MQPSNNNEKSKTVVTIPRGIPIITTSTAMREILSILRRMDPNTRQGRMYRNLCIRQGRAFEVTLDGILRTLARIPRHIRDTNTMPLIEGWELIVGKREIGIPELGLLIDELIHETTRKKDFTLGALFGNAKSANHNKTIAMLTSLKKITQCENSKSVLSIDYYNIERLYEEDIFKEWTKEHIPFPVFSVEDKGIFFRKQRSITSAKELLDEICKRAHKHALAKPSLRVRIARMIPSKEDMVINGIDNILSIATSILNRSVRSTELNNQMEHQVTTPKAEDNPFISQEHNHEDYVIVPKEDKAKVEVHI
ncbi:MAG: hypothetical protein VYC40_05985 [Pseudomonadota bacterium]|nr:hypothetical protein [Pseudomonadota bacterium]